MPRGRAIIKGNARSILAKDAYAMTLEAKIDVGRLFSAWKRGGKKAKDFEALLLEAGYRVSRRTLNYWHNAVMSGRDPVKVPKNVGRPHKLTSVMERMVVGYVMQTK